MPDAPKRIQRKRTTNQRKEREPMPDKSLPIIESCDNCGVCCMEQTTPPGFSCYATGKHDLWPDENDLQRWTDSPEEAKELVRHRVSVLKLLSGEMPCCWLDTKTMRCRFYEYRPEICRSGLERGDEGCRTWRREYGIDA